MDFDDLSTWGTGTIGAIILAAAVKFVWPLLNSNLSSALAAARASDELMKQIVAERDRAVARADVERDRAVARADAAEKRAEEMSSELHSLKRSVDLLNFQLKMANDKIEALTAKVGQLEGGKHA